MPTVLHARIAASRSPTMSAAQADADRTISSDKERADVPDTRR